MIWVLAAVAGGFGTVVRSVIAHRQPAPRATITVNIVGTVLLAVLVRRSVGADVLLVVGLGFAGGLTTFSTWMLDAIKLAVDDPTASPAHIGEVAISAVSIAALLLA
jgi:CrcB protein